MFTAFAAIQILSTHFLLPLMSVLQLFNKPNDLSGVKPKMDSSPLPHIAIFPFLSKGHTIPLIHFAHIVHRRRLGTLTFFTTPLNAPFLRYSLSDAADIIELPFPEDVAGLPPGVESTDTLPSISLFLPFVAATKLLRPHFERAVASLPGISFLISDGFYGWTTESASKFGFPRIVFYGMGSFAMAVSGTVARDKPHARVDSYYEPFEVPAFPGLKITRADLNPPLDNPEPSGPMLEFVVEQAMATTNSHGLVVNSFYELETDYVDQWNRDMKPTAWCVGPVCLAQPKAEPGLSGGTSILMDWLESRLATDRPVLYVAFGTQADVSAPQLKEIALGLESSGLDFLWVVRAKGVDLAEGFEERVGNRGKVVREWVDQLRILRHESIKGFVSHCGWNSVVESVCAGVPILAWPMMADQPLNAKFVVDVARIGLRIQARDGTKDGLVGREEVEKMTRRLLLGEEGRLAREKVKALADAAEKAVADGGSSASALEQMINEVSIRQQRKA